MKPSFWPAMAAGLAIAWLTAPPAQAEGNVLRGESIYTRCLACHALNYNRTGPKHCGLFGRPAGSLPDFMYSDAMKNSHIVWNEETLNRFLTAPLTYVPGTSMGYAGIPDAQERADLLAYLKKENESPICTEK